MRQMCILSHWGVQLVLVYSWARPAIFAAGKGRKDGGGMFLARQDYVPGEFMLSPSHWRQCLSASASALAQCLSFQRYA